MVTVARPRSAGWLSSRSSTWASTPVLTSSARLATKLTEATRSRSTARSASWAGRKLPPAGGRDRGGGADAPLGGRLEQGRGGERVAPPPAEVARRVTAVRLHDPGQLAHPRHRGVAHVPDEPEAAARAQHAV